LSDDDYQKAVTDCQRILSEAKLMVIEPREKVVFDRAWDKMEKLRLNYIQKPKNLPPFTTKGNNGSDR
jgi:hypothetical protein